jgi:hypothetical protein
MSALEQLLVRNGDPLGDPDYWNTRLGAIHFRTAELEARDRDLQAATDQLITLGLFRIDETVRPVLEALRASADLGAVLYAFSTSTVSVGDGLKAFEIDEDRRAQFAPPIDLVITDIEDPARAMIARRQSYNPETGLLLVTVVDHAGSGSGSNWEISLGARGTTAADVIAAQDAAAAAAAAVDAVEAAADAADASADSAAEALDDASVAAAAAVAAAGAAATHLSGVQAIAQYYLGPASSNPTTAPGGGPLLEGMLYWHTTENEMRTYDGADWGAAFVPAGSEVVSFNGRGGAVSPAGGDYTADLIDLTDTVLSETDVQGALEAIVTALAGKAATSHSHGDLYYTEGEVDALLAAKAATSHSHGDLYYTEGEVDALLAAKAAAAHTHDDRYFTESEITTLLAGKSATGHVHTIADVNGLQDAINLRALSSSLGTSATMAKASAAQVRAMTADKVWTGDAVSGGAAIETIADASTIALNWTGFLSGKVTLTASGRTIGNPTNGVPGTWRTLLVYQDGTGNRTFSFGNQFHFAGKTAPTATLAASSLDVLSIFCETATRFLVFAAKDVGQ